MGWKVVTELTDTMCMSPTCPAGFREYMEENASDILGLIELPLDVIETQ